MSVAKMTPEQLEIGKPYFLLLYLDRDLRVPEITTLIFSGVENHEGKANFYLFTKPPTHAAELRASAKQTLDKATSEVLRFNAELLESILDWQGLVEELQENFDHQQSGTTFN